MLIKLSPLLRAPRYSATVAKLFFIAIKLYERFYLVIILVLSVFFIGIKCYICCCNNNCEMEARNLQEWIRQITWMRIDLEFQLTLACCYLLGVNYW